MYYFEYIQKIVLLILYVFECIPKLNLFNVIKIQIRIKNYLVNFGTQSFEYVQKLENLFN